ncbi:MAG TPA: VanZ family protein [Steroidobacteraceae bacterium]|nr:VanZ family protein [Steroidobacteraceae bacterium]
MSAPGFLLKPHWVSVIGLAAVLAVVIFCDLPGSGRFIDVLQNSAHAPAFGLVAVLLIRTRRVGSTAAIHSYALAWVGAVALGALVEVVQAAIGRDADSLDVFHDAIGATCALSLYRVVQARKATLRAWAPITLAVLSFAVAIWPLTECAAAYALRARRFPDLVVLRSRLDFYFVTTDVDATDRRIATALPWWGYVAHPVTVELTGTEWPGVRLVGVMKDWSAYRFLTIDVENPGRKSLPLIVRLDDYLSVKTDDPYYFEFELPPHSRQSVSVLLNALPAAKSGRPINVRNMRKFSLFHDGPSDLRMTLYSVRLTS